MAIERQETDVLVAGGGVAGLSAAAAFAAEGFRVTCVDPVAPVTAPDAAGTDLRSTAFLQPAVALLTRAGLWPALAPHAAPLKMMRIADADADGGLRAVADFDATELGLAAFGYNLPNWLLRRELTARLEALPGARLLAPAKVERVTARSAAALVRLSEGPGLQARLVLAADGRDSGLRAAAGIGVRRWGYGQKALAFVVRHALPHGGVSTEIHRSGGPFTLVPLPDRDGQHHSAVVWMDAGPRAAELAAMSEPAFEDALNARACGVLGALTLSGPRSLWPISAQIADRLDGPRLALIAEAAHVLPPIGAQGLNTSLGDIALLLELAVAAREAGADIGGPELLARFHRRRYPALLARVLGIDALNRAAMAGSQPLRDLRLASLRALHAIAPARRAAMRLGMGP